jgi:crossover junction endodeoxyribonuclease RuvC
MTEAKSGETPATIVHCILGIDPGLSGAMSFYFPDAPAHITAEDLPLAGGEIDAATFAQRIRQMAPTMAIIEQVNAMPKQGVSSTFKFGQAYGTARGIVTGLGIPLHLVTPATWKKHFRLDADKEKSRALALRLWPTAPHFGRKKDHGRAEAALLARYAAETLITNFSTSTDWAVAGQWEPTKDDSAPLTV